ncbi:MAG: Pr6Pr family membrane protein [Dokdonella sp.]
MSMTQFERMFAGVIAVVAWSALILQYALLIELTRNDIGVLLGTLRYFSFFTILSNLLIALTATYAIVRKPSGMRDFFTSPLVRGGAALCIGITLCIYFAVLASTWAPQGAQWLADVTLHYVAPVLYLAWWGACVPHGRLRWSDVLRWMLFPVAYLSLVLLRGAWLHEYPYPFVDVDVLGTGVAARNCVGIGVLFLAFGLALVAFDRAMRRPR